MAARLSEHLPERRPGAGVYIQVQRLPRRTGLRSLADPAPDVDVETHFTLKIFSLRFNLFKQYLKRLDVAEKKLKRGLTCLNSQPIFWWTLLYMTYVGQ